MIFDCVFCASQRSRSRSLRAPAARLVLAARGRHGRAGVPRLLPLQRGPCGAAAAAWSVSVARVAGAGRAWAGDVPGVARAGAGAVGIALGHAGLHSD